MTRLASLAVLVLALASCTKDVPDWCNASDMSRCGAGQVCNVDTQTCVSIGDMPDAAACSATMPCAGDQFCEVSAGICHDCGGVSPAGQSAELCTDAAAPVCDGFVCRACEVDAECDSGVCRHDGTCAAAATVIYAAPAAIGVGDCSTPANACDIYDANDAVDGTRTIIHLAPGTYNLEAGRLMVNADVTIVGRDAIVRRNANTGPVIETMNSADLTLEFATVRDGTGSAGDGLVCNAGSSMTLRGATVDSCDESGIDADGCTLSIEGSTFSGNTGGGLSTSGGSLTVSGSTFSGNTGLSPGVRSGSSTLVFVGNLVANNGSTSASAGGLVIENLSNSGAGSRVEFNTIARNTADTGLPTNIDCAGSQLLVRNNIIWDGVSGNPAPVGNCSYTYSIIGPSGTPTGMGVTASNPQFMNTTAFTLSPTSPARGMADPASDLTGLAAVDANGTPRPSPAGGRADIGYDEVD
jgi:hypothetical protein